MIERFNRARFESILPSPNGVQLWVGLGIVAGEFCYLIPVKPSTGGVFLYVRSTIDCTGIAADTAQDSIRVWIANDSSGKPLSGKEQRWIARTPGWDKRLLETLRNLWKLASQHEICQTCSTPMLIMKVKKPGPNLGRHYLTCPKCEWRFHKFLEEYQPKEKETK